MKVRSVRVAGSGFNLYPLSDVHWPLHDHDKLSRWRDEVAKDPKALVTLGGDMFDFARGKYRAHLQSYTADSNSANALHDAAMEKVEGLVEFLRPVSKKIIAACVGNHFWTFQNGRVSDQELTLRLGIGDKFVGALGLIRIDVKNRGSVLVALHHDAGRKGGTISSDLLVFQHWSHNVDADIYILGHTHRQYVGVHHAKITAKRSNNNVTDRKLVFARSGAYLKGYTESVVNPREPYVHDYAEVKMLSPAVFGVLKIGVELSPVGKIQYRLGQETI
jgi:hypothetical protein